MNLKTNKRFLSFILALLLLFVGVVVPSYGNKSFAENDPGAKDDSSIRYPFDPNAPEDVFTPYLTGNDISESYIQEFEMHIQDEFWNYIHIASSSIDMEYTPIEELYPEVFKNEEEEVGFRNYENNECTSPTDDEEELFEIAAVKMIHRNISAMNKLAAEGLGYINGEGEFIFTEEEEFVELWRTWNFKLKWNKFTVNFDSDYALIFSIVFLVGNIFVNGKDIKNTISDIKKDNSLIETAVLNAFYFIPSDVAATVTAFFSSDILGYLVSLGSWITNILTTAHIAFTVFKIIYGILAPSITDCVVVLYNALSYCKGIEVKACWVPLWRDKWGISIKSL